MQLSNSSPKKARKFAALAVIFLSVGLWLVWFSTDELSHAMKMRSWPTVEGVIVSAEVIPSRAERPKIVFSYSIDGIEFSKETDLGVSGFGSQGVREQTARTITKEYPPGKVVTVRYNPADHSEAYIRPGFRWSTLMQATVGVMALIASIVMTALWMKKRRTVTNAVQGLEK